MDTGTFVVLLVVFGLIGHGIKNALNTVSQNEKAQTVFWAILSKWIK